jgi:hypothetical protein
VDENRFQQLDSEEWCSFLAMEGRSLEEELAPPSEDGEPKTKRSLSARRVFTHGYALRCIEWDLGLPKNICILRMTTGLTSWSRGRSDLSLYSNYHGKDAVTPEQVKDILALFGVKDQPLWYLGGTGSWTKRSVKPSRGRLPPWCVPSNLISCSASERRLADSDYPFLIMSPSSLVQFVSDDVNGYASAAGMHCVSS